MEKEKRIDLRLSYYESECAKRGKNWILTITRYAVDYLRASGITVGYFKILSRYPNLSLGYKEIAQNYTE